MDERSFQTLDVYLASAIVLMLKLEPGFKVINGKTFFVFPIHDDLYRGMTEYNNGVQLPAFEFASTIKRLRGEAITRRSGANNG